MSSGNNPYQSLQQSNSSAFNNAPYTTQQTTQSSLLLNSVNLAWSQPTGCILVAPKPEPEVVPEMTSSQDDFVSVGDNSGQPHSDSPTSSVSTVNTSEYGKISSVSSDFEKLSIADSTKTNSNLESVSHQAVAGSTESFSAFSDSGSNVSFPIGYAQTESTPQSQQQQQSTYYKEVDYHWYYQKDQNQKDIWQPFSMYDSYNLEYGFRCGWNDTPIPTNGTRYDVLLRDRTRKPVYWSGPSQRVQRCSWFYKRDSDYRFVPYDEEVANILENTYR